MKPGGPRRPRLSREAIARAALAFVDEKGASALSLRSLSAELGAGAMSLYRHVPSREAIVADVVALLLDEIELTAPPGGGWAEGAKAVARSYRAMALRHPRAFELVANASDREPPVVDYARRLRDFYAGLGMPPELFERNWSILDSFETGFLRFETRALLHEAQEREGLDPETAELAAHMAATVSEEAFEAGLEIIVSGLAARLERAAPRP
jgi:AcrR family transcriptional regulator